MLPKTTTASATSNPYASQFCLRGSQENPSGQEGSRDPENRQLKMPSAGHVEGQHSAEIDTKKTREVRTIMLRGPAEQSLQQKK